MSGPQVEQLLEIMHFFGALAPDPKQVTEVPKIFPDDVPMRTAVRDTRLAEQLVEVPTIVYVSSLRALVEQNEDIPVPRGRGGLVGLRGLQGFSLNRIQQRLLEQITLTFQFRVVDVFKVLVMDRVQQLHPLTQAFAGWGFSHFSPKQKKCGLYSVHAASSAGLAVSSGGLLEGRSWWHVDAVALWPVVPSVQ